MPIFLNIPNSPEFIKVKGKIYKKTNDPVLEGKYVEVIEKTYESNEDLYFASQVEGLEDKLRPVYSITIPANQLPQFKAYGSGITNTYSTFIVQKNNTHPYFNQGSTQTVVLCGFFQNLELNLLRGKRYIFRQNDASNAGNTLTLASDPAGNNKVQFPTSQYTGTPGVNGSLTFVIPNTAADTYYLTTQTGTYLGIKINVDQYVESLPSHTVEYNALSGSNGYYTPLN